MSISQGVGRNRDRDRHTTEIPNAWPNLEISWSDWLKWWSYKFEMNSETMNKSLIEYFQSRRKRGIRNSIPVEYSKLIWVAQDRTKHYFVPVNPLFRPVYFIKNRNWSIQKDFGLYSRLIQMSCSFLTRRVEAERNWRLDQLFNSGPGFGPGLVQYSPHPSTSICSSSLCVPCWTFRKITHLESHITQVDPE